MLHEENTLYSKMAVNELFFFPKTDSILPETDRNVNEYLKRQFSIFLRYGKFSAKAGLYQLFC